MKIPTKLEQQYFKHQKMVHGGQTIVNCPFCRKYREKIEKDTKQLANQ